jgi:hypothetical protein
MKLTLFASFLPLDDFSMAGSSSLLIMVGSSALASAGTMLRCSMFSEHETFTKKVDSDFIIGNFQIRLRNLLFCK